MPVIKEIKSTGLYLNKDQQFLKQHFLLKNIYSKNVNLYFLTKIISILMTKEIYDRCHSNQERFCDFILLV